MSNDDSEYTTFTPLGRIPWLLAYLSLAAVPFYGLAFDAPPQWYAYATLYLGALSWLAHRS